jgi:hypothetical protein
MRLFAMLLVPAVAGCTAASTRIDLPHTGIAVQSATERVEVAPDDRLAVPPDVPVALTAAGYFADRDPVFEAALSGL